MLGFSYGEVLVLLGAAVYLIGPKDLPRVSRIAGRALGRAVSYVTELRGRAVTLAEDAEVTKLHEEVQASVRQLRSIRDELRSGVDIFRPGQSFAASRLLTERRQPREPEREASLAEDTAVEQRHVLQQPVQRQQQREASEKETSSQTGSSLMESLAREDLEYSSKSRT